MTRCRVTHHGYCHHDSAAWSISLSQALDCASKTAGKPITINPQSRMPVTKMLMKGENVWHQGVHFTGRLIP